MALDGQTTVDVQTAAAIITAAVQTDWDRTFTSNDKIKSWLLEQVQKVPFDPRHVTLLEYVKSRMDAAQKQQLQQQPQFQPQEASSQSRSQASFQTQQHQHQHQQQQQQQQQYAYQQREETQPNQSTFSNSPQRPPFQQNRPAAQFSSNPSQLASSSYATSPHSTTNGTATTLFSDEDSSGRESEDDQQYQFDLSDFAEPSKVETNTFNPNPIVGGLPPSVSQSQSQQPTTQPSIAQQRPSAPIMNMYPYATGHAQVPYTASQTFSQPSTTPQHSFYQHEALPVSQPMGMNPVLFLNNQAQQQMRLQGQQQPQVVAPHQLMQQNTFHVNATSLGKPTASSSSSASASPVPGASSSNSNSDAKAKRGAEVEVVIFPRKEGGQSSSTNPAKRKKSAKDTSEDPSRRGASATAQKHPSNGLSSSIITQSPQSVLSSTANTPQPPSDAHKVWNDIRKPMEKVLHQATRSPHKTVMNMFKLLSPFVSEPPGAVARQGSREAFITDLRVPAAARLAILDVIKDETDDDFDVIFVTDPRATTLLHEWTKDLAMIAKGKYSGPEPAEELKRTSRSLMAVFKKLPISLDVLQTLKGVGSDVATLSRSDAFDEVTKDTAKYLVKKWKALIDRAQGGGPKRAATPSAPPAASVSKKRVELAGTTSAGDEESRKKRRTSPTSFTDKALSSTSTVKTTSMSDKLANPAASSAARGPGTQPIGRLPTTIKPTPGKVLPSFAKRKTTVASAAKPAAAAKPTPAAPAASAVFDPFALSLQHMAASKESAAGVGMSVGDTLSMLNKAMDATSSGKAGPSNIPRAGQSKKKSVRWAEEDKLKMIKIVDKLVYGDEFGNEITTSEYFNTTGETVGEHEGVAMKGLVEQIDWEEPQFVDRKFSQETLDLVVEYPSPELMEGGKCERDVQTEREKTVLAPTYFSEEEIPPSPAEPTPETSAPSIPAVTEPIIMRLSHDLANDQAVQLSILQAQTVGSLAPPQEGQQTTTALQTGQSGPSYLAAPHTSTHDVNASQQAVPPAVAGADLNTLLAQLSGSGLAASLNTVPPAAALQSQHHQPLTNPYLNLQQYTQSYQPRY